MLENVTAGNLIKKKIKICNSIWCRFSAWFNKRTILINRTNLLANFDNFFQIEFILNTLNSSQSLPTISLLDSYMYYPPLT